MGQGHPDASALYAYPNVSKAVMDAAGRSWVYSRTNAGGFSFQALQSVADQGTTQLADDVWHHEVLSVTDGYLVTLDRSPDGDLWAQYSYWHSRCRFPQSVLRRHGESWLSYGHTATLSGVSSEFTHTTSISILVAAELFEQHLPLVAS